MESCAEEAEPPYSIGIRARMPIRVMRQYDLGQRLETTLGEIPVHRFGKLFEILRGFAHLAPVTPLR